MNQVRADATASVRPIITLATLLIVVSLLPFAPASVVHAAATATATFDDSIRQLSSGASKNTWPAAAIDGSGTIHVVYTDYDNAELYYIAKASGGSWTAPDQVGERDQAGGEDAPWLVYANNALHLTFSDNRKIYYRRGSISGSSVSWGSTQLISSGSGKNYHGTVAVDSSGNVHFAWISNSDCSEYQVRYRRMTSSGAIGGIEQPAGGCGVFNSRPRIAITSDGQVHIAYVRGESQATIYRARRSGSGNWTLSNVSQTSGSGRAVNPDITAAGNDVYVVYGETIGNHNVYWRRAQGGGDSWSSRAGLSTYSGYAGFPSVRYSSVTGRVYFAWADEFGGAAGKKEVWFQEYDPTGNAYTTADRISNSPEDSNIPFIGVGSAKFEVVWQDKGTTTTLQAYRNGGSLAGGSGGGSGGGGSVTCTVTSADDALRAAQVRVINPNTTLTAGGDAQVAGGASNGDLAATRLAAYRVLIVPDGSCTKLAAYRLPGESSFTTIATPSVDRTANMTATPGAQGAVTITLRVKDEAGRESDVTTSLTYDTSVPVVVGTPSIAVNGSINAALQTFTVSNLTVSDLLHAGNYWGVWVANEELPGSGSPPAADPDNSALKWYPVRVPVGDRTSTGMEFTWNLLQGIYPVGTTDKPATYRVYVRFLDGAGNFSSASLTTDVAITSGYEPQTAQFLPYLER
jgi:hypothetical protein